MLYMVVERFKDAPAIYRRLREKGRMMPEGLEYVSSWIDVDLKVCWQLMRAEDESLFERWIDNWKDSNGLRNRSRSHVGRSARDDGKETVGKPLASRRYANSVPAEQSALSAKSTRYPSCKAMLAPTQVFSTLKSTPIILP